MDTTTFFLIIIILVAIVLVAVGIYLILVLHEARKSILRLNNILDHVESIIDILDTKIARPASSLVGALAVVKEVMELVRGFVQRKGDTGPRGGDEYERHEPKTQ